MAFGKITKQDLVDAGLDPDKLAEFQSKGVTKTDLETLGTSLETKLTTTVTDLIKNSFAELEGKLRTPVKKENENGNNQNEGNRDEVIDDQTQFLTDPVGYVNKKTNGVVVAAAVEFKKMSRDMAWKEGVRTLRGMRNPTLLAEITEEWKKYPPEKMAQYNTDPALALQQIHDMILGKHHDEIIQDTNKKDGKFNLVHSGSGGGSGNTGAVGNSTSENVDKTKLSEKEQVMARKFGMTDEEWIKQGEDMEKEEEGRRAGALTGVK
jgi:hypothetical protein